MTRICFVSLYAYPLFNSSTISPFGGSEVRSWLLGVGLSKLPGNEVSFVVFDHGQPEVEQFDRVKVYRHSHYKSQPKEWGLIQRLTGKLAGLRASLRIGDYVIEPEKTRIYEQVDADVYCGFGVSPLTAEIAAFCRKSRKGFLLFAGSDIDFSSKYGPEAREVNPHAPRGDICYFALMHADLILTQTETQRRLLQERFGRDGFTLRNPVDLSDSFPRSQQGEVPGKIALWIGKSDRIKRPEILLQLALAFPESEFVMVLNRADPDIFQTVLQNKSPNVQVLEWVPLREAERLFARASVLINTSLFEGFPNTFLQAGKYGVPILSLQVDPEGFIERCTCGILAQGSFDQLVEGFDLIRSDQARCSLFARNIRAYIQKHHALTEKIHQLDQILAQWKSHG